MVVTCDIQNIDDIEDITKTLNIEGPVRENGRKYVPPKAKRLGKVTKSLQKDTRPVADSIIPGTQKIYVKTWGCSHNNSDSEYMAGQLASFGYKITEDSDDADLWLLNSCTVKNPSQDSFHNAIDKGRELGKYVVVAGCVPQGQPRNEFVKGLSVVGVQQIDRVVEVVEETIKGNTVRLLGKKKSEGRKIGGAALDLPKIRKNPLIEIIAINTGCLNQCTYCKTKHARGELGSYPPEEIVERAKQSFQEGVVEIWLTSEDTGAYGRDIGVTLPDLLWKLVEVIPDGAMLRLGMTNPPYILEHLEEMSKILSHPRVYSFLHVPVQSGSDSVLMDMKREYCRNDFKHVVNFLQERAPGITIATDFICGFPTETDQDFEDSCSLVEEYKFPSLFINQFYPRPGTPAARLKRLANNVVKNRTRRLTNIFQSYLPYEEKLHKRYKVLITEYSKDGEYFVGHNKFYDQVLVPKDYGDLMGKMVEVEIIETGKHFMKSRLMEDAEIKEPGLSKPLEKGAVSGTMDETICLLTNKQAPKELHQNWTFQAGLLLLFVTLVFRFLYIFIIAK
ncbi:threonylcarbamoyladenosine tRNA methylthiotransferase-like [Rhopilema esculentum]|uniref:threonylcarbamoyladenosine tRNA methylthiotransferase-like n=1 Tax=Rhopilema esculentum TaxID=499914 RepID=UPI0031D1F2FE